MPCQFSTWQFGFYEGYEHVAKLGFDAVGLGLLLITSFASGYASPLQYIIVKTDFNPEELSKNLQTWLRTGRYLEMLPRRVTLSVHLRPGLKILKLKLHLIRLDR